MSFLIRVGRDSQQACWDEAMGTLRRMKRRRVENSDLLEYFFGRCPELFEAKPVTRPRQVEVSQRG